MEEIVTILEETAWTRLAVEVNDNGKIIKDNFKHERDFLNYINHNLSKYDVNFLDHELIEDEHGKITILFRFEYASQAKILSNLYIQELADDIMLELNATEILDIKKTESKIREQFLKVLTINTENVLPMNFASDEIHHYLREDDEFHTVDQQEVLANAPSTEGPYITLVKVVN